MRGWRFYGGGDIHADDLSALIFSPKRWSGTNGMLFGTGPPNRNPAIDTMTIIGDFCRKKRKAKEMDAAISFAFAV